MRKCAVVFGLLLLIVAGCLSSSSATAIPPATPLPPCKDGACIQQTIASRANTGDLFILFTLTDQAGQANAARPPRFTQSALSLQVYQLAADQSEKLLAEQALDSEGFICWVTNTAAWSKGKLSAVCGLPVNGKPDVQIGDRLKVKLSEFNFEQVVEVTSAADNSAANRPASAADRIGGTRIVLAPPDCSGWTASGKLAEQLYQAGEIILYRLRTTLISQWADVAEPAVFIDECAITVELSPLGDPTPYIQLMQQPGQFELIDVGLEYHAPGKVLRTTNHPSPTVPISPALQSALPLKTYDVIATNADLYMDQLMTMDYGDSLGLQFGFKESAAQKLAKISTAHSISMNSNDPYYLCILLDNVVEFCPSISMPHISGGVGFKFDDRFLAQRLSSILRNGELPVELKIIKVETIYSQTTN
jgi:hypothetical protein